MPNLNTQFYKGPDAYSDGAIEDELPEIVGQPNLFMTLLAKDNRWPLLYHLAPERRNLLEWYPFRREAALLEIGAGCGALTGLFLERVARVTAAELSLKRAKILAQRYQATPNLAIMVGNVADMSFAEQFDYITLIGVLEYAGAFCAHPDPHQNMLAGIAKLLKPEGILFVAVENRFGLKYFAGARDDHTARLFDGLEGYPTGGGAETFSRDELSAMLNASGFVRQHFYYPHPDYKLPTEIFSDLRLPADDCVLADAPNYDQERLKLFNEQRAWQTIARARQFPLFANSFLVLASRLNQ